MEPIKAKPAISHINCRVKKDLFCFVCAQYVKTNKSRPFAASKTAYECLFGVAIADNFFQQWFVPGRICDTCRLIVSTQGNERCSISVPAILREPENEEDCFYCQTRYPNGKMPPILASVKSVTLPIRTSKVLIHLKTKSEAPDQTKKEPIHETSNVIASSLDSSMSQASSVEESSEMVVDSQKIEALTKLFWLK